MKKYLLAVGLLLGLCTHAGAATMFWSQNVTSGGGASCGNGTFNWDSDSGTAGAAHKCWATTTGGATAAAAPGAADTATFDGASGGGTVTLNMTLTLLGITAGAFTGTLDFSVNNNTITLTGSGFSGTGSGTRTFKFGSNTMNLNTCSAAANNFSLATQTGLTWTPGTLTVNWNCNSGANAMTASGLTIPTLNICPVTQPCAIGIAVPMTFTTLTIHSGGTMQIAQGQTTTVTNAVTLTGTNAAPIAVISSNLQQTATLALSAAPGAWDWVVSRDITYTTNLPSSLDCINLGHNTGLSCTAPNVVAGGGGIIIGSGI